MNSYDIDGVIYLGQDYIGLTPLPEDIIITGRSFEEREYTEKYLMSRGIVNTVYYNSLPFNLKTRVTSGQHKGNTLLQLKNLGINIDIHFEDDEIQAREISLIIPSVKIVMITHNLTDKENKWQP